MNIQLSLGYIAIKLALGATDNIASCNEKASTVELQQRKLVSLYLEGIYYLRLLIFITPNR